MEQSGELCNVFSAKFSVFFINNSSLFLREQRLLQKSFPFSNSNGCAMHIIVTCSTFKIRHCDVN